MPDVLDDDRGVSGLDRYRAVLAHMVGHRRWSTPQIADNWSPFQRMAVEFFEDCRIETLVCREYPGLAPHLPGPASRSRLEDACDPETTSCLRHRLAMLVARPARPGITATATRRCMTSSRRFHALLAEGESTTQRYRHAGARPMSPRPAARATSWPRCISTTRSSTTATTTATCGASSKKATKKSSFDEERKLERNEEIVRPAATPLSGMGLPEPDLPPRLGQPL